jgi:hypothetical protein
MDGGGSDLTVHQLPELIKEWMALEEDLRALSAEVREKRKRATTVRSMISGIMKGAKVGQLNISAGSVTTKETKAKAPLTKKYIADTLTGFFGGDRKRAEECAAFLDEHRPLKVNEKLTLLPRT